MTDFIPIGKDLPDTIPAGHKCTVCKRKGAVYGVASINPEVDAEYEDGEIIYRSHRVVILEPEFFACACWVRRS